MVDELSLQKKGGGEFSVGGPTLLQSQLPQCSELSSDTSREVLIPNF